MVLDSSSTPLYEILYWGIIGLVSAIAIIDIILTKEKYKLKRKFVLILIAVFVSAPWIAEILTRIIYIYKQ